MVEGGGANRLVGMATTTAEYNDARVRVRYAETDQMGIVHHANYLAWFEVGRVELLRALGYDYKRMEEEGCRIAVAEVNIRYKQPAKFDDEIVIRTRVVKVRGPLVTVHYGVMRAADGAVLCEGETKHVAIGAEGMTRRRIPETVAAALASMIS